MSTMTKQEAFSKAYLGMAGQKWMQSKDSNGSCLYRGPDNLKCAAGHVLDNGEFREGHGITTGSVGGQVLSKYGSEAIFLLSQLQYIHDTSCGEDMKKKFEAQAKSLKLVIPEVK